jgi:hypothetical protein
MATPVLADKCYNSRDNHPSYFIRLGSLPFLPRNAIDQFVMIAIRHRQQIVGAEWYWQCFHVHGTISRFLLPVYQVYPPSAKFVCHRKRIRRRTVLRTHKKYSLSFTTFMVLFTIFAIPIIIALPFLISGFIGRM